MKKTLFLIIIGFLISLNSNGYAKLNQGKPETPKGYTWKTLKEIKAKVLMPNGWFFNAEQQNKTYVYFITKEDYTKDPNQMFSTGFSLNAITDIGNKKASDFINEMFVNLKKQGKLLASQAYENGNLKGYLLVLQINNKYIEYELLYNIKSNKVYIATFETATDKWEANEEFEKNIMSKLNLSQDF